MLTQNETPLLSAVEQLIDTKPAYFRIPGHRLERGVSSRWTDKTGDKIFAYDVTETPLTDDLHAPEGAIRRAQELLSELYGADESFFLVNGTTCGNEAMIISAAFEGQEIMVARNAHKSALMGLVLSGAKPVYVMPEAISEWGIQGAVEPERVRTLFRVHPECRALFLVSPTYYGVCSDLEKIAGICHENGALLLVDEAHGAYLYFDKSAKYGALACGADICVQSMHKVTGALTQSSVLHIKSHGIRTDVLSRVAQNLHLVQSTSPSYLLMISLDCARYELAAHGEEMYANALRLAQQARKNINAIQGFSCMECIDGALIDRTRLVISAKELGLTGYELDRLLFEKYAVNMELSDEQNALAIVTYANTQEDMDRLVNACLDISRACLKSTKADTSKSITEISAQLPPIPEQHLTPREAYFSPQIEVPWQQAQGKTAAQLIAPYPPGIPVICPGEVISRDAWEYIERFRAEGRHIHGAGSDGRLERVKIVENS